MTNRASTTVRYETRTTIDSPIGDVFERLADLDGYRTWMRHTGLFRRSGQTSDGPLGQGTAYFDATRMGTFRGEVTDYEAPARIGFSRDAPLVRFRPDGSATELHPRGGPGQDDRSSRRRGSTLRSDAVDEAGRRPAGEKRARPNRRVVEALAGVGVGPRRPGAMTCEGTRRPRFTAEIVSRAW